MSFDRNQLPEPVAYFESQGLRLTGPSRAKWRTTECRFHGGSDSMRINTESGAWVCMSCGEKGGDVLAYEIAVTGADFVQACKAVGAWVDDGKPQAAQRPTVLSPRDALQVLSFEASIVAVAAGNLAAGVPLSEADRVRLLTCANRINRLAGEFAP
jgi:hypothetical protein